MIVFYNKQSGAILGAIEGRIHGSIHLNQWIGDKNETDRLIFTWIKNQEGQYEPDVANPDQKKLLIDIDKTPMMIYDFYVDPITKALQRKE